MGMILQNEKVYSPVVGKDILDLPTVSTASGSVANFTTDMQENLVEVECEIVYQQASGTPSPSNPLPITTFSEMNIMACGHNLINVSGATITVQTTVLQDILLKKGTYTLSVDLTNNTSIQGRFRLVKYGSPNTIYIGLTIEENQSQRVSGTVTFTEDTRCSIVCNGASAGYNFSFDNVLLEQGNFATAYQAYNGNTYNIPFGQTVAKGKLNLTTGVLEITHGYIASYNGESINEPWVSSKDEYVPNTTPTSGANVVYPLTNSTFVQLDSTTIQALLNENNLWCDTGDTSVKFILSVGEYVNQNT